MHLGGSFSFKDWLESGSPGTASLDFRLALGQTDKPITFSVMGVGSDLTESVRELGAALGMDPANRGFTFDQVLSIVLQRGIVLTDNRRLPLKRRFSLEELQHPADLRDGAAVGGELYRLKNGYPGERARFEEIRATFRKLTRRELDVRSRPAASDGGEPGLVIEPTVAGLHGERLVELSGAGMQEALVLSVLLRGEQGRLAVLDRAGGESGADRAAAADREGPGPGSVHRDHAQR